MLFRSILDAIVEEVNGPFISSSSKVYSSKDVFPCAAKVVLVVREVGVMERSFVVDGIENAEVDVGVGGEAE